jgi:S-adenosylmethionine:tRNA ribosyltransferase-isomerase
VLNRHQNQIVDRLVKDLPDILHSGDLVVVNDTKVIPARLCGKKVPSGGRIEMLFIKDVDATHAEVLINGRVRIGQVVEFQGEARAQVVEKEPGRTVIQWLGPEALRAHLQQYGDVPLPPYLKREPVLCDQEDYQTMFANVEGAVASPTAGLHFTPTLLQALSDKGIGCATITLHVGPGTFQPVKAELVEDHTMHPEWFDVAEDVVTQIQDVRQRGGRVVAVGTTVARSLESATNEHGEVRAVAGKTRLFILPGFQFRVVDVLMTNFHFPETTLLMLVSGFAGVETVRDAYAHAVQERYRFYSYGDAMLIQ